SRALRCEVLQQSFRLFGLELFQVLAGLQKVCEVSGFQLRRKVFAIGIKRALMDSVLLRDCANGLPARKFKFNLRAVLAVANWSPRLGCAGFRQAAALF